MAHPLQALRDVMAEYHIDAYLIPTADFHGSEYVGAHFACREYLSGFTGSPGPFWSLPTGPVSGPTAAIFSKRPSSWRAAASAS